MKKNHFYFIFLSIICLSVFSCDDENNPVTGSFRDLRDGQIYNTVRIGKQTWMVENLKYLPSVVSPYIGSDSIPYYYVYGYNGTNVTVAKATSNFKTYGVLYNWSAVMDGDLSSLSIPSGVKGVCPNGWHVPSDDEWKILINYLGGTIVAGAKLKESGTTHWSNNNPEVTNETGFTALPGGFRGQNGTTNNMGSDGIWWSTTESSPDFVCTQFMQPTYNDVVKLNFNKDLGFSVRCLKD